MMNNEMFYEETSKWADSRQATNFECTLTPCDLNCGFLLMNSDVYYVNQDFRIPTRNTILRWVASFRITGSTLKKKSPGRNSIALRLSEATYHRTPVVEGGSKRCFRFSTVNPKYEYVVYVSVPVYYVVCIFVVFIVERRLYRRIPANQSLIRVHLNT
ncbi:hypothetical protein ANN_23014 [Periplaneta americana]|uniref:DUF4817 domain-containing protein n=1 Tax=Periplaneta americana TaxID=6978 RepID=A0ABQ8SLB8_PERAM|nr:hypothetical protein ANN_23014 [Periplaneta americana]